METLDSLNAQINTEITAHDAPQTHAEQPTQTLDDLNAEITKDMNSPTIPPPSATMIGRVFDSYGEFFAKGLGIGTPLGIQPGGETEKWLFGKNNLDPKYQTDAEAFGQGVIKTIAASGDAMLRIGMAPFMGVAGGVIQAGKEITDEEKLARARSSLGLDNYGIGEPTGKGSVPKTTDAEVSDTVNTLQFLFPEFSVISEAGGIAGKQAAIMQEIRANPARAELIATSRLDTLTKEIQANHVLSSEEVFNGTKDPTPEQNIAANAARDALTLEANKPQPIQPPHIDDVAREIAPEVFTKYDSYTNIGNGLRDRLKELGDARTAEIDAQIQAIQDLNKGGHGKVKSLEKKRDAILEGGDTPEMAAVRQQILNNDIAKRDLAPQVSAAYRSADEFMPKTEPIVPETAKIDTPIEIVAPKIEEPPTQAPEPVRQVAVKSIADDVAQNLTRAGRPVEEAQAAGKITASFFDTMSKIYGGKKGTAEDWYAREGAQIVKQGEKIKELAQGEELNQNSVDIKIEPREFAGGTAYDITHPDGQIGTIMTHDRGDNVVQVSVTSLISEYRNKGFVADAYDLLARKILGQGKSLWSDAIVSPDAVKLYESLKKRGYDVWKNPEARKNKDGDLIVNDSKNNTSVFKITENKNTNSGDANILNQGAQGKIRLATDSAKAVIRLMKSANASTFMHESGHHFLDIMTRYGAEADAPKRLVDDVATIRNWLGDAKGKYGGYTVRQQEKFARGFERYLMEGVAPSKELAGVFGKFKQWLTNIYKTFKAIPDQYGGITNDIRAVMDRMLAENPEKTVIAPERDSGKMFADIHEHDAEQTAPAQADKKGDEVKTERHKVIEEKIPEDFDVITRGTSNETTGRTTGGAEPNGNADAAGSITGETGTVEKSGTVGAGGSAVAAEGDTARAKSPLDKLYTKVPRKPLSLSDFVKKNGGIKDIGGDVAHSGGKELKGVIRPKTGKSLDDMTNLAWENGYFPEAGAERPDINSLLNKLHEDLHGTKQYSDKDHAAVDAYNSAMQNNAELDRMVHDAGIDIKGKTTEQVWSELADHMSQAEKANEIDSMTEAHKAELAAAEKETQEWYDSRGDAWEPDKDLADNPRTLKDLEHERDQERAAKKSAPYSRPDELRGNAGQSAPEIQDGGGQSRRGSKSDGGGDAANEKPTVGKPGEYVKDSGKPNNDALNYALYENTPGWLQDYLNDYAAKNPELGGKVETLDSMRELAKSSGLSEADLASLPIVQKQNRIEQLASAEMFKQKVSEIRKKAEIAAASGSQADMAAFFEATQDHALLIKLFQDQKQYSAEASRNLGIRRAIKNLPGMKDAEQFAELFQQFTGKNPKDLKQQADFFAKMNDPVVMAQATIELNKPKWKDKVLEFRLSMMLSGWGTHFKNIVGNMKVVADSIIETGMASGVSKALGSKDATHLNEVRARVFGVTMGNREAWLNISDIINDHAALNFGKATEVHTHAIGGVLGKVIRAPLKALEVEDNFFKAVAFRQEIYQQAFTQANRKGLVGDAFDIEVAKTIKDPSLEMIESAYDAARYQTLQKKLTGTAANIQHTINESFLLKNIVPFFRTNYNSVRYQLKDRSLLGLFNQEIRDNLAGKNGERVRDMQIARLIKGTTFHAAVAGFVLNGTLTDSGSSDRARREADRQSGIMPNSVKFGNVYVGYGWVEPLASSISMIADFTGAIRDGVIKGDAAEDVGMKAITSVSKRFMDMASLKGASDFIKMLNDNESMGGKFSEALVSSFAPNFLAQTAKQFDPEVREVHGIIDALKAKIPGERQTLMPKYSVFGQPIDNRSVGPVSVARFNADPVVKKLGEIKVWPSRIDRKLMGVKMSNDQYEKYQILAGQETYARLQKLLSAPGFGQGTLYQQQKAVKEVIDATREHAKRALFTEFPKLADDIIKLRKDTRTAPAPTGN